MINYDEHKTDVSELSMVRCPTFYVISLDTLGDRTNYCILLYRRLHYVRVLYIFISYVPDR